MKKDLKTVKEPTPFEVNNRISELQGKAVALSEMYHSLQENNFQDDRYLFGFHLFFYSFIDEITNLFEFVNGEAELKG